MKTITKEFLLTNNACSSGIKWVVENKLLGLPADDFINKLMESDKFTWANWLIGCIMDKTQRVKYALFVAEQMLRIFEEKYPNDDRPRKAIEATKEYLKSPTEENKKTAAIAAAIAAAAATNTAYDDTAAAYVTAYANADDDGVIITAYADSAAPTEDKSRIKVINYGLSLIKNDNRRINSKS
jgi:hypothetical protein